MQIPKSVQLPLYEPMYVNGQLSQVWAMFFESLVGLLNNETIADLIEVLQLSSQLPSQASIGQNSIDLLALQNNIVALSSILESDPPIPLAIQHSLESVEIPALQQVFLCQQFGVDPVQINNIGVITP